MNLDKFLLHRRYIYDSVLGKYGLLHDGAIVKIHSWSTTIIPQELHFKFKRRSQWSYISDFVAFDSKRSALRKLRRLLHARMKQFDTSPL